MSERDLFLAALEIDDPAARQAHLQSACAGDGELLGRVEALLASHESQSQFLVVPVAEQFDNAAEAGSAATILIGDSSTRDDEARAANSAFPGKDPMQYDSTIPDDEIPLRYLQPSTRPDSLGRLGHYEILEVVGRGAFGTVLRAFDETLQRVVAIKVMAPELAATSPARKRFLREAVASAQIRHENVVSVYAVEERPIPYLVMEYIPGVTLQKRLDERGPLDIPTVLRLGIQICEGLAAAHAKDLIHRDVKPGNILLESGTRDHVKITDFGLARAADDASMTQSGMIAGTPMYMAPEQALGHKLDQRADLFSLGSVLYQMASGRPPFRASTTLAVLKRVAEEKPRPIPEIIPETPQWLCDIIAKLHAKNPDDRYQSAREVADVLADCEAQLRANAKLKDFSRIPSQRSAAAGKRKWVAPIALVGLLPLLVLTVTELTGTTRLFHGQEAAQGPIVPTITTPVAAAKPKPDADGWVQLFNGKDLTGWKFHPDHPGHWEVKDGILRGSKRQRHLFSERGDYKNFHLRAECKINLGGDSGIAFRAPLELVQGRKPYGFGIPGCYEAVLQQNRLHSQPTGSISEATGVTPPTSLGLVLDTSLTQPDEWFTYEVIAKNNHFITKINGVEAANCTDPLDRHQTGHLALQVWNPNTVVQFRKIEIKELPANPPVTDGFVALFNGRDLTGWKTHSLSGGDWKVVDGAIDGRGTTSYLFSESGDYDKFHLRVEAKINGNGDAGVYFRTPFDVQPHPNQAGPAKFTLPAGYEAAIALRSNYPTHTGALTAADGTTLQAGPLNPHQADEWFVLEVIAEDNRIRTLVDGKPAADYIDENRRSARGHIALQVWGPNITSVQFRKIEFKELPASTSPSVAPAFAVAPFDAAHARAHQKAWAKHLGVQVEKELILGTDQDGKEVRLSMVLIPPGEFLMGSSDEERVRLLQEAKVSFDQWAIPRIPSEGPQHRVRITKPFWLSKCEINIRQFRRFVQAASFKTEAERDGKGGIGFVDGNRTAGSNYVWNADPGFPQTDDHPVVNVSWNDCAAFCNWLSQQQGQAKFALPTEAQWEYACRAGTTTTWHTGDSRQNLLPSAWLIDNADRTTHPVGRLARNAFGLYDMHGNVGEWCRDWYSDSIYVQAQTDNPGGPTTGITRVIRGGQFDWNADHARSAFRVDRPPTFRQFNYGFRVSAAISDDAIRANLPTDNRPTATLDFTNSIGMEFVIVPKGKSWLGGGKDKLGDNEVEIPADFYLGKFEVTQEEWEKVMGENPSHFSRTGKGLEAVKDIADADLKRFPVECVSWDQCQIFVEKLNSLEKESGWVYRLPKRVEWEYACRGGPMSDKLDSAFNFYFAKPTNTLLPEQANFKHDNGLNRTCKVGSYSPNRLGLFDMHGNVHEWGDDAKDAAAEGSHPIGLGGFWNGGSSVCSAANHSMHLASLRTLNLGLRLARVPSGAPAPDATTTTLAVAPFTDADVQRIAALPAEQQVAAVVASLKERNPGLNGTTSHKIVDGVVTELNFNPTDDQNALTDLSPVRALTGLTSLNLWNCSALADLGPLQGLPLTKLLIGSLHVSNQVRDLTPLQGMRLTELQLYQCQVEDLKPLAGMPLIRLRVSSRQVRDCAPLKGMPLTTLDLSYCTQIQDFTPLTGLPLTTLHLNACQIRDLQPLLGLKLTEVSLAGTRVQDLEQLQGMPLKNLAIHRTGVTDLTPLQGMELKEIFLTPQNITQGVNHLRDMQSLKTIGIGYTSNEKWPAAEFWDRYDKGEFAVAPFTDADVQRIAALPAAEQVEEVRKELMRRNPGFDGNVEHKIQDGVVTEFSIVTDQVTDISPIRVFNSLQMLECRGSDLGNDGKPNGQLADVTPLKGMNLAGLRHLDLREQSKVTDAGMVYFKGCRDLRYLSLGNTQVTDSGLAHFNNCKALTNLWLYWTKVGDAGLVHFQDCKDLTSLNLAGTKVSDAGLAHFRNCKNLRFLSLDHTQVSDAGLAHFEGIPLTWLWIDDSGITDLTPLKGMPLEEIHLTPKNIVKGLDVLRDMKSLKTVGIAYKQSWPVAEFWARYDKGEFAVAPFTDADVQRIADLPAPQQVEEVRKELVRRNPGFDGKLTPTIEKNVVTQLSVNTDEILDISPVRALTGLVYLDCRGTYPYKGKLSDLSPLAGMKISRLDCSSTQIADLAPLSGLPLTFLHFNHNPVSDLAPLKGMPLEELGIAETKVADLSPLKGMKLRMLGAQLVPVTDLSPLAGMPLKGLDLYHTIGVTSLEPLRGMPLEGINLQDVPVSDLSPLAGMTTLRSLLLQANKVSDLSPLAGLKLTDLFLIGKEITDLSPLKGLPLSRLSIDGSGVSDLRPLQGMPLVEVRLNPKNITQGMDVLRAIPSLKTIGIDGTQAGPAAEFWERLDKGEFK